MESIETSPLNKTNCSKCQNEKAIIKNYNQKLCQICLIAQLHQKFHRNLKGKTEIKSKDKILIGLSFGFSSWAIVDLWNNSQSKLHKRAPKNEISVLHIDESFLLKSSTNQKRSKLKELSKRFECFKFLYIPLEIALFRLIENDQKDQISFSDLFSYYNNQNEEEKNVLIGLYIENAKKLMKKALESLDFYSEKIHFVKALKRRIFYKVSELINCEKIVTGESSKSLTKELLFGSINAEGSEISHESDFRGNYFNKEFVRPFRDFEVKLLVFYCRLKNLPVITENYVFEQTSDFSRKTPEIDLVEDFIEELQRIKPQSANNILNVFGKIKTLKDTNNLFRKFCSFCGKIVSNVNLKEIKDKKSLCKSCFIIKQKTTNILDFTKFD